MAFWKNLLGSKNSSTYLAKGDRLLVGGDFAEAKLLYERALEAVGADCESLTIDIVRKRNEASDGLAKLNLREAERCLADGHTVKLYEHLELAAQFACSAEMVEQISTFRLCADASSVTGGTHLMPAENKAGCAACIDHTSAQAVPELEISSFEEHLSREERFEIMVSVLPDDLPQRYSSLGGMFVDAYLLSNSGDHAAAGEMLQSISDKTCQDIVLYEMALIRHRQGKIQECEQLLLDALQANDRNALCCLALVDLYVTADRYMDAVKLLESMVANGVQSDQAHMMLGDIQECLGNDDDSLQRYALLLGTKYKKDAATKIIAVLERQGKSDEARQVYSRYLKGCC